MLPCGADAIAGRPNPRFLADSIRLVYPLAVSALQSTCTFFFVCVAHAILFLEYCIECLIVSPSFGFWDEDVFFFF